MTILTDEVYDEDNMHKHPLVRKIHETMGLDCCFGFIRMLKLGSEWIPLDLFYGVPLHDVPLNRIVCNKIQKFGLFSEANLHKHSTMSRELTIKVLDFVSEFQDQDLDLDADGVPFPCKELSFANGVLQ